MRATYERHARAEEALRRVRDLRAQTVVIDVEPLVAYWDTSQDTLDQGADLILARLADIPELKVACFTTNSSRRPSRLPSVTDVRVVYIASAGKPMRTGPYRDFPRPGVVIGDQIATDGILARRLGYAFVHYQPRLDRTPAGPRLLQRCGKLIRPLLFTRPARHRR